MKLVHVRHRNGYLAHVAGCLALIALVGCGERGRDAAPSPPPGAAASSATTEMFVDRAQEVGLDFLQFNGMTGERYMVEVTGSGAAFFDYDNDGDLDAYLVQGHLLAPGKTLADAIFQPRYPEPITDRLYRNDLTLDPDGRPRLRYVDVTEEIGLAAHGYGMGVTAADYDGDGWIDLYLTNFGANQLLRNRGRGADGRVTFEDVTQKSGTDDQRWSVTAAFFDYDRDGDLDLFVGNYIAESLENPRICRDFTGARDYCGPGAYPPYPDSLFRNRGDGTFENVSRASGIGIADNPGATLGVVTADFTGDGWLDIYVTNDSQPNNLWINHGDGTFTDEALFAGCAVNAAGKPEASMGVDAADFDNDGDLDLFMTHLTGETNTLYRNDGKGMFDDVTIATGIGPPSRPYTSFGTGWLDVDNDGWLDLFVASGAVKTIEALARANDPFPVHQPNQLYRNVGGGRYEEITARAGKVFELSEVSRGVAFGDVDNDGDTDMLVANNGGQARLMINEIGNRRHWLGLRVLEKAIARDALAVRVALVRPDGSKLWQRVRTEGSYCSANDPRVLFGLGEDPEVAKVQVFFLDGSAEQWSGLAADRYHVLRQGTGQPVPAEP